MLYFGFTTALMWSTQYGKTLPLSAIRSSAKESVCVMVAGASANIAWVRARPTQNDREELYRKGPNI